MRRSIRPHTRPETAHPVCQPGWGQSHEPAKRGASEPSNRPRPDTPSVAEVQSWSATGNRTPVDSDRRVPGWIGVAVIVAVEGPSAAGKSTWCRATSEQFVAEYTPTGEEPDGSD